MKISKSLITAAVVALLPLAAVAGEKDKTAASAGTATSAQFYNLDANGDGRISPTEAAIDSKIVFKTADQNSDGFLDSSEFAHLDLSKEAMPSTTTPSRETQRPKE